MAVRSHRGGSSAGFIFGVLLTLIVVIGWFLWTSTPDAPRRPEINLRLPPPAALPEPTPMPNPEPTPVPNPAQPQ